MRGRSLVRPRLTMRHCGRSRSGSARNEDPHLHREAAERHDHRDPMGLRLRLGRERGAGHLPDASGGSGGMSELCEECGHDTRMCIGSLETALERIRELERELQFAIDLLGPEYPGMWIAHEAREREARAEKA